MLIVLSGLPGVGKTTDRPRGGAFVGCGVPAIDSIEQALRQAGVIVEGEGYAVAHAAAAGNLGAGQTVVTDCMNPWPLTRDEWRAVAERTVVPIVEVEVVCSDPAEHRRRVESRAADIAGHVLKNDPDWSLLPRETPVAIRRLLRRCLAKDRRERLDSAADARLDIQEALTAPQADATYMPATAPAARAARLPWAVAAATSIAAVALLVAWLSGSRARVVVDQPLMEFEITPPEGTDPSTRAAGLPRRLTEWREGCISTNVPRERQVDQEPAHHAPTDYAAQFPTPTGHD